MISHRPIMDLLLELFLTALFTAVFSLLVAKLLSLAAAATDDASLSREFSGVETRIAELTAQRSGRRELRAQLAEGSIRKVDKFSGERSVDESPEEVVSDVVGGIDCDVAVEKAVAAVSEEKIVEHLTVGKFAGERLVDQSPVGVYDVAVEERCGGRKLDGFDDVDKENAVAGVSEEKIVEHLMVDDEIVEDVGGDNDSLENSGAISEKVEKIGGNVEKIVEHLVVGDKINEVVGGDYDRFENSGAIDENVGKPGVEGVMVLLWSKNPVVDDDVAVEERNEKKKLDGYDNVDGENAVAGVSEVKVVEDVEVDNDSLQNLGANDEKIESIGVETDIMVNLGRNEPLVNEVAGVVEHVGVDNDSSEISGASVGKIENVEVVGDIMVNLEGCDDVVVNQGFQSNIIENVEEKWLIGDENNEKAKVNDEIVTNIGSGNEKMKSFIDEDGDWEGIERSELEKDFAAAANYVFCGEKDVYKPKLDNDVKTELYGLNKVALEGPCREPQPMAIKVSARAKWNAWQRLGNMSPEVAMEQYISLLSDKAPEWMEGKSSGDGCKDCSRVSEASPPDIGTNPENQLHPINESVLELNSTTDEGDSTGGSISVNKI